MSEHSTIEWTDATWNPIVGCSVVSPGCTNCYAMRLAGTRMANHPTRRGLTTPSKAGPVWNGEVRLLEQKLTEPLRWKRPRMIFVCAHGDLFHESVPDEWIDRIFAVMALAPQHTFQILTKRSARMRDYLSGEYPLHRLHQAAAGDFSGALARQFRPWGNVYSLYLGAPWPLPNVWLGVSVEDQERAEERIDDLLETPAEVRWISAEPLLGPLDLRKISWGQGCRAFDALALSTHSHTSGNLIDWVVVGGESGPCARPMSPDWARSLRDQCAATETPFFFKQWGEWAPIGREGPALDRDGIPRDGGIRSVGRRAAGRLLDGVEHNGMPGGFGMVTPP